MRQINEINKIGKWSLLADSKILFDKFNPETNFGVSETNNSLNLIIEENNL